MTDRLDLKTPDGVSQNTERIAALFPHCVVETESMGHAPLSTKKIDFDLLRQELSRDIVEGPKERYRLEWPGKREAIVTANMPTTNTLRPVREDSVNFDTTENLYIEGDNLEVLKLLQESYLGKVKMIYIDPPYNTGNDFVYRDNFAQDSDEYKADSGMTDELGNRLVANPETAGRYHSDWLTMMYPRLKLARNLLTDDGVIFISIDDNEVHNLRKMCDDPAVFGESCFVAQIPWRKRTAKSDVPFGISQDYEWLICYANPEFVACLEGGTRKYFETPDLPNRPWRIHDLTTQRSAGERPNSFFTMVNPKTGEEYPANPIRTWAMTEDTFPKYYSENRIVFPGDYDFLNISKPAFRYFKEDDEKKAGDLFGFVPVSTNLPNEVGMSQDGTKDFGDLFENKFFSYPKPIELLKYIIKASTNFTKDATILDFFSGSGTSAQAIMQLNAEDGGNRKFIMVQLPEKTDEKSEAYKAGYQNICEIGKERIRRAGKKLTPSNSPEGGEQRTPNLFDDSESAQLLPSGEVGRGLDVGFRVYRLDTSNMQDVYYRPQDYKQDMMTELFANHIKPDRTPDDLVAQVMLDWGLPLSLPIVQTIIAGKTVYKVAGNALYCCFDEGIDEAFVRALVETPRLASHNNTETQSIASLPLRIVFHDYAFANDTAKENVRQLLKQLSGDTEMRVV